MAGEPQDWSYAQQVTLAVTPKISSLFSLAGSSWIIAQVLCSDQKRHHPYHRLLLAMSVYAAAASVGGFLSTWPIPARHDDDDDNNPSPLWSVGTTETCTAQGFFLTLAVAFPMYYAFLALYYMLVVKYNLRDRTLRRIVEPTLHGVAALWALGTALSAVGLELLNDATLWCWIAPLPENCLDSWSHGTEAANCERGDNAWLYRWLFYYGPLWICILVASKLWARNIWNCLFYTLL
jgi:hypothetical protein